HNLSINPLRRPRARLPFGRRIDPGFVDEVLQFLAGFEVRDFLGRDVHLVTGLRIASLPRLAPPQPEAAEPAQADLLPAMQRVHDALEDGVNDDLGVLLREVGHARHFLDEFGFGHPLTSDAGNDPPASLPDGPWSRRMPPSPLGTPRPSARGC